MAEKQKQTEPAATEEPKKHVISIYDQPSLVELNRAAYGAIIGARKRQESMLKRITEMVKQELRRA